MQLEQQAAAPIAAPSVTAAPVGSENLTSNAGDAEQLIAAAARVDAELDGAAAALPGQPGAAPAPAIPLEHELAGMFELIGTGAGHFLPSVRVVLTEDACKQLGDSLAPVARKYGLERHLAGFAWRVELQAALVAVPIAMALNQAVRHDLAVLKRRAAAAELGGTNNAGASSPLGAIDVAPATPASSPQHLPAIDTTGMLQPI